MSRVRVSPSEWRIEDPGAAHLTRSSVPAVPVGYMKPVLTAGVVFSADRLGRGRKAAADRAEAAR